MLPYMVAIADEAMSDKNRFCLALLTWLLMHAMIDQTMAQSPKSQDAVRFTEDVLPVLARNCFACHGPDEAAREADLRLDIEAEAASVLSTDEPQESELLARILSDDPDSTMPPPDSGKQLSAADRNVLKKWILSGAKYQTHWAFVPPVPPKVPTGSNWTRNPIDCFIESRAKNGGLKPASEANPYTLIRRLSVDLIGLLPSIDDADAFAREFESGNDDGAYSALVEKLLNSKQYGERWARPWLDLARYSDTNGYEKDRPRSIWPYRDWVIRALNDDKPFDQFTIEQLAGDMLPNATLDQRVATGFHRNTMLNEEGGIDPLEYRFYAMVDRVATTGSVWMGLTIGCAQCHSHKYDPISHTDYYRMLALLNNADEPDLAIEGSDQNENARIENEITALEADLHKHFPTDKDFDDELAKWIDQQRTGLAEWQITEPTKFTTNLPKLEKLDDNSLFASGDFTKRDVFDIELKTPPEMPIVSIRLEALPDERLPENGPGRAYYEGRKGDFFLSELSVQTNEGAEVKFESGSRSFGKIAVGSGNAEAKNVFDGDGSTGWSTATREGQRHTLVLNLAKPVTTSSLHVRMLFERHFVAALGRFRFSVAAKKASAVGLPINVEQILAKPQDAWTTSEQERIRLRIRLQFLRETEYLTEARKEIDKLRSLRKGKTTTMVMHERPADNPRKTFRHHRGEWLSPREPVSPQVPAIFPTIESAEPNRLEFAKWLVNKKNPLVARVVVNRAWRELMGHGLVRSDGDFGTQSEPPTHPALLDWLATEFVAQGWSMKWLHRTIVSSATYRQQSKLDQRILEADPTNRYFVHGPRYRVDAERVRDIVLSASGLLADKVGGPSVRPPQPASVTAIAYGGSKWKVAKGEDRYRRSLYTFSKRTAPFAAFTTFDAPTGENCVVRRSRSNTPLQALTLLNDEMYLQMAVALGKAAAKVSEDSEARIEFMFRRLLTRKPTPAERARLMDFHEKQLDRTEDSENSALTMVARVLMNLDEVITQH